MKKLGLVCGLLFSLGGASSVWADILVRNGGNAVVCRNLSTDQVKSIVVLDVYEAGMRGDKVYLGGAGLSYEEKVRLALSRLERLDPDRAARYLVFINLFLERMDLVRDHDLIGAVDDSMHIMVPRGCKIEQVATQRPLYMVTNEKPFVVNADLWDLLDQDNKAALLLHEAILQEAVIFGHEKTPPTRVFNSYLFSNLLDKQTHESYMALVDKILIHPNIQECMRPMVLNGVCEVRQENTYSKRATFVQFSLDGVTPQGQNRIINLFNSGGYKYDAVIMYQKDIRDLSFDILKHNSDGSSLIYELPRREVAFGTTINFTTRLEDGVSISCVGSVY